MLKCRIGTIVHRGLAAGLVLAPILTLAIAASFPAHADGTASASEQIDTFRCDSGRSNSVTDALQLPLTLNWRATTTPLAGTTQAPVYADGVIYVAVGKTVYAIRAADGTTMWTYVGKANFAAPPTISDGALYIGSDDSLINKLSLKNGMLVWSKSVGGPIHSAPVVANGHLYFGTEEGKAYEVDPASGGVIWTYLAGGDISTPVVIDDSGQVFFASGDNKVYCLSGDTGHLEWQLEFDADPTACPPCYANDTFYVAAGRELYALNPRHGALRWRAHFTAGITSPPAVSTDHVIVATDDNHVLCLNEHGNVIWTGILGYTCTGPALLAGETAVVATQHGIIYGFNANDGTLAWQYVVQPTGTNPNDVPKTVNLYAPPLYADGSLYIFGDDGSVSAFTSAAPDTAGPVVYSVSPQEGTTVTGGNHISFGGKVVDEGSGIDPSSVLLTIDGKPIRGVRFDPAYDGLRTTAFADDLDLGGPNDQPAVFALANGLHKAVLTAKDWKGNSISHSWGFYVTGASKAADQPKPEQTIVIPDTGDQPQQPTAPPAAPRGSGTGSNPVHLPI